MKNEPDYFPPPASMGQHPTPAHIRMCIMDEVRRSAGLAEVYYQVGNAVAAGVSAACAEHDAARAQ